MKILLSTGFYLPGYKGGGPIRTIANMLEKLGNEIQFFLITADRDLGDESAYPGIASDGWQQLGRAQVYYASPGMGWLWRLMKVIQAFDGAAMHLNSFFSFRFSILPLIYWRMLKPGRPVIAPRAIRTEKSCSTGRRPRTTRRCSMATAGEPARRENSSPDEIIMR